MMLVLPVAPVNLTLYQIFPLIPKFHTLQLPNLLTLQLPNLLTLQLQQQHPHPSSLINNPMNLNMT